MHISYIIYIYMYTVYILYIYITVYKSCSECYVYIYTVIYKVSRRAPVCRELSYMCRDL